uniref:CRISPR-associated protein Cas5 n=1 Tax=Schlesneria paludicola TaxID=360056 RepID=A0A7C4QT92_9PLAN
MESKRVAKVTVEAPIVSFRYPHFLIGRQPTFDMPPPSTIFGHVASALGTWPRFPLSFAYVFHKRSRGSDLEHQHIITGAAGKFPGDLVDPLWRPPSLPQGKQPAKKLTKPRLLQKSTEATVQPHARDFLFDVTLELYLDPVALGDAFRSPVFTVVLGRSQDLASVRRVELLELQRADSGYVERTILPGSLRRQLPWGVTVLMPRYIGPPPQRQPTFEPYIVLQDRIYVGKTSPQSERRFLTIDGEKPCVWFADPTTPEDGGGRRLLWFHTIDPREFGDAAI